MLGCIGLFACIETFVWRNFPLLEVTWLARPYLKILWKWRWYWKFFLIQVYKNIHGAVSVKTVSLAEVLSVKIMYAIHFRLTETEAFNFSPWACYIEMVYCMLVSWWYLLDLRKFNNSFKLDCTFWYGMLSESKINCRWKFWVSDVPNFISFTSRNDWTFRIWARAKQT